MKKLITIVTLTGALVIGLSSSAGAQSAAAFRAKHPKIANWVQHQGGDKMVTTLSTDLANVHDTATSASDSGSSDLSSVLDACESLQSDVADDQANYQIPSRSVERVWSHALTAYQDAATACVTGINDSDANGELEQSASDIATATGYIKQLSRLIK